jgi:hypothetical protein
MLLNYLENLRTKDHIIMDGAGIPNFSALPAKTLLVLASRQAYKRTIIHYHVPPDKWAIFFVIPSIAKQQTTITIYGYFIGQLGWNIIDVLGDGNCGFYSLILGLEDLGIKTFAVDPETESSQ